MAKKKNRRQQFPPITVAALEASRRAQAHQETKAVVPTEPEPTNHIVLALESHGREEDAAWDWFSADEYRRGLAQGKTRKQVGRSLRRTSFLAGYRAGSRAAH